MYDGEIKNDIINNLEEKVISIVETNIALLSQGYLINRIKRVKLEWSSILIHSFENIDIFSSEQQHKIENLYDKVMAL